MFDAATLHHESNLPTDAQPSPPCRTRSYSRISTQTTGCDDHAMRPCACTTAGRLAGPRISRVIARAAVGERPMVYHVECVCERVREVESGLGSS